MNYKVILKEDYLLNRDEYLKDINYLYENDDNKLANIDEIEKHLDFIFGCSNSLLVMLFNDDKLISMVNAYEYNNIYSEWCIFLLFTKKDYRNQGLGYKTLKIIIDEIKKYNPTKIISGIEEDNIASIKLHKKVGFVYNLKVV